MLSPKRSRFAGRYVAGSVAALAGLTAAALVGVAVAKSFTLSIAHDATVKNAAGATSHKNILVDSHGRAVYVLSGDSKTHQKCTKANGCFKFWPPVTVSSVKKLSKAPGIKGRLRVWHRGGMLQATLGGHPLYTFVGDTHKRVATGEGLNTFGGIWHVMTAGSSHSTNTTSTPSSSTTTPSSTTSPSPCLYPPCQ